MLNASVALSNIDFLLLNLFEAGRLEGGKVRRLLRITACGDPGSGFRK